MASRVAAGSRRPGPARPWRGAGRRTHHGSNAGARGTLGRPRGWERQLRSGRGYWEPALEGRQELRAGRQPGGGGWTPRLPPAVPTSTATDCCCAALGPFLVQVVEAIKELIDDVSGLAEGARARAGRAAARWPGRCAQADWLAAQIQGMLRRVVCVCCALLFFLPTLPNQSAC